jgi:hypothetical protein
MSAARARSSALAQGQLGLALPLGDPLLMAADLAADLFLVGEEAGQIGALLHQFVFHLLDDQAHHLLGIFCLVEQGRQVGIDDVGQAGKNTHDCTPVVGIRCFSIDNGNLCANLEQNLTC